MSIPTSITLSSSNLTIENGTINTNESIVVADTSIATSISISTGLINSVELEIVVNLTEIEIQSSSTVSELYLSSTDYNNLTSSSYGVIINNNGTLLTLNKNIDYKIVNNTLYELEVPSSTTSTTSTIPNSNSFITQTMLVNGDYTYIVMPYEGGSGGEGSDVIYTLDSANNTWATYNGPTSLQGAIVFIYNNTIYNIGGFVAGLGYTNNIYSASINTSTGAIGSWTSIGSFPIDAGAGKVLVIGDYAYIFGFQQGQGSYSWNNAIYMANINNLSSWSEYSGLTVPFNTSTISDYFAFSTTDYIYLVINNGGSSTLDIYEMSISNGSLSTFTSITNNLPSGFVIYNYYNLDNTYCILSGTLNGNTYVYYANFNSMGAWTSLYSVSTSVTAISTIILSNTVYGISISSTSSTLIDIASYTLSSTSYYLALTNSLPSVPSIIYYYLNLQPSIQWNSFVNKQIIGLSNYSISNNQITYNYETLDNELLIEETNYPLLYINTQSFNSTLQSFSLNINGYNV